MEPAQSPIVDLDSRSTIGRPESVHHMDTEVQWIETADKLFKVQMSLKRLREENTKLSKELQALSGGRSTKRGRYEYKRSSRKGAVNYSSIPELKRVDLEAYRKPEVTTWKLQVVE